MPLPKSVNRADFIRRLKELGFSGPHKGTGDHPEFMRRGTQTFKLPNKHKRKDIGRPLLKKLLPQAGVTVQEWTGESDDEEAPADDDQRRQSADVHAEPQE